MRVIERSSRSRLCRGRFTTGAVMGRLPAEVVFAAGMLGAARRFEERFAGLGFTRFWLRSEPIAGNRFHAWKKGVELVGGERERESIGVKEGRGSYDVETTTTAPRHTPRSASVLLRLLSPHMTPRGLVSSSVMSVHHHGADNIPMHDNLAPTAQTRALSSSTNLL